MERRRRQQPIPPPPPPAPPARARVRGVGPVMREEDFLVPPDYDRPNRMGLIPGGAGTQSVPNYFERDDLKPQTQEMNSQNRQGEYFDEVRRRAAAPRRLKAGGPVKAPSRVVRSKVKGKVK